MKIRDWGVFTLLAAIWGSSYLFIKIGLNDLQPFTLVAVRLALGAAGMWIIVAVMRLPLPRDWKTIAKLSLLGFTNTTLPFVLITWGETRIDSGVASVLNATVPLFSLIIAHFFLEDEKITWLRLGGLTTGFLGIVLIFSEHIGDIFGGGDAGSAMTLLAQLAVIGASVAYAGSSVFAKTQVKKIHPMMVAGFQLGSAFVWSAISAVVVEWPLQIQMSNQSVFALAWLGILGTCIAYVIYFHLINVWGATRTTLVTYLIPVLGVSLGALVLGEQADWRLLAGFALIASGIGLVNARRPSQPAPKEAATPETAELSG